MIAGPCWYMFEEHTYRFLCQTIAVLENQDIFQNNPHVPCVLLKCLTRTIHVWHIYLHEWLTFMVNVGKYRMHG